MNNRLRMFAVLFSACVSILNLHATGINDGDVFRLVNVATGKAVTNGDVAAHNTYLSMADVDNGS